MATGRDFNASQRKTRACRSESTCSNVTTPSNMRQRFNTRQSLSAANLAATDSSFLEKDQLAKPLLVVNSVSHPLKISWLAEADPDKPDDVLHRVAMTSCPGKRLKLGRDGVIYERCLSSDISYLSKSKGISMIVCLLNQAELSCLGIWLKQYASAAEKMKVEFIHFPVVEMAPFASMQQVYQLCEKLDTHLSNPESHVLIHCRGGLGRTGTLAACLLLFQRKAASHKKAIEHVRHFRSPRAIESRKQEECVEEFARFCSECVPVGVC